MKFASIAVLLPVCATFASASDEPTKSCDVVRVTLTPYTLADGLESFYIDVTVAEGWHVYANSEYLAGCRKPSDPAVPPELETKVEGFVADGKAAWFHSALYPRGVVTRDAAAKGMIRTYDGSVRFTAWLSAEELEKVKELAVKVRVVASDGERQLAPSVITAAYSWAP